MAVTAERLMKLKHGRCCHYLSSYIPVEGKHVLHDLHYPDARQKLSKKL